MSSWAARRRLEIARFNRYPSVGYYADDLVILSRGKAAEALEWTRKVIARLGLALNEAKTCIRQTRKESFNFLGYTFGPHCYRKDGHWYLGASPSKEGGGSDEGEGGRPAGTGQCGNVGGSAGSAESDVARLVGVLQLARISHRRFWAMMWRTHSLRAASPLLATLGSDTVLPAEEVSRRVSTRHA